MRLQELPEWQAADSIIEDHHLAISIQGTEVTLAPGATIEDGFEEMNDLQRFPQAVGDALRTLARFVESKIPMMTIKITSIGILGGPPYGLILDDQMVTIVGLNSLPGTRVFVTQLEKRYYADGSGKEQLFSLSGFPDRANSRSNPQHVWILVSIPQGDFEKAEALAAECGMKLTRDTPTVELPASQNSKSVHVFPMDSGDNVAALIRDSDENLADNPQKFIDLLFEEDAKISTL